MMTVAAAGCFGPYGCDTEEEEVPLRLEAVHEWGVFQQRYGYNDSFMSAGGNSGHPPMPEVVMTEDCKPVIYFHGIGIGAVNVTVKTNATEIVTIPQAQVGDGEINWQVTVTGDVYYFQPDGPDFPQAVVWDKRPEENGTSYEYLFYEGRNQDTQDVVAKVTKEDSNLSFNLSNIGQDTLGNVLFLYLPGSEEAGEMALLDWPSVEPGGNREYNISTSQSTNTGVFRAQLKNKLLQRGLVEQEAEDLLEYWVDKQVDELGLQAERSFTERGKNETAHILYFMPQSKLDARLPMTVSPAPANSITRVGLMWVQDVPVEVVE